MPVLSVRYVQVAQHLAQTYRGISSKVVERAPTTQEELVSLFIWRLTRADITKCFTIKASDRYCRHEKVKIE